MGSLKISDHPESEKIIIEEKIETEVKHEIPYATRVKIHGKWWVLFLAQDTFFCGAV